MKKWLFLIIIFLIPETVFADEVIAPALQFDFDEYRNYFKKSFVKLNLKTHSDYIISCKDDIIGTVTGDLENIKIVDIKNELTGEISDMKSVVLKTRYETYSFLRLYKNTGEIYDALLLVNPLNSDELNTTFESCELKPYRGQ